MTGKSRWCHQKKIVIQPKTIRNLEISRDCQDIHERGSWGLMELHGVPFHWTISFIIPNAICGIPFTLWEISHLTISKSRPSSSFNGVLQPGKREDREIPLRQREIEILLFTHQSLGEPEDFNFFRLSRGILDSLDS
jgi:hypothetical protein